VSERNGKIIFTVADCTGHGVPGAFMSLLGITLLNEIVKVHGISRSDDILKTLDEKVIQSVLQYREENVTKDGMDIALCVIDPTRRKLQYSGGMHDLVLISNGKLAVVRADRKSIGPSENYDGNFSFNEIDYKESDMIYLFSDGYQDQFGGEKNKKFLRSRFYDTLLEISPLPPKDQKELLETTLNWWMGNGSQTDDITVLGVRLH
jgi:serine phosphatase RsbU (regulator of sigma subunit)